MAEANRDVLSKQTADLVDDLHNAFTSEPSFATICLSYDFDVDARRWYASMVSEIALLVGDESPEYVKASASLQNGGSDWLYSVTVLTEHLVITCAGRTVADSESPDHGPVEAFSRSTLETLELISPRADPFKGSSWPGTVQVLGRYSGRENGVVFTVKGGDVAPLIMSLRADLV